MKRLGFVLCWLSVAVLLGSLLATQCFGGLSECIDATCRVTVPTSPMEANVGTGCVFEIDGEYVYVLTNAHIAEAETAQCEFWRHGHKSGSFRGRVVQRQSGPSYDCAVVAVPIESFGGVLPAVIPVAPREYVLQPGETITSVGCARGAWSTAWKGHVLGYSGTDLYFSPPPADGRSGSAIFDASGERIVGLLKARPLDDSCGIATSLGALYRAFQPRDTGYRPYRADSAVHETQYNQPRCQNRNCPGLFGRWRKSPAPPENSNPWPTLPGNKVQPQPIGPLVDVAPRAPPVNIDLSGLTDVLQQNAESSAKQAEAVASAASSIAAYADVQRKIIEAAQLEKKAAAVGSVLLPIAGKAVTGDWQGAKEAALSSSTLDTVAKWFSLAVISMTGVGGIGALVLRLLIPFGLGVVGKMLLKPKHTAADDVADVIGDRLVKKINGNLTPAK